MAEQKTRPHTGDVDEFLAHVEDPVKRADSQAMTAMLQEISGHEPVLWGTMVGFGQYHYKYASGHEGDAFRIGFAPRKGDISIYTLVTHEGAAANRQAALLAQLGKHKAGKSCLYIRRLSDVDMDVLRELAQLAYAQMLDRYPE